MHSGTVAVLIFNGFADWEPSYALAELRREGGFHVLTLGYSLTPVVSMGGLRVVPDRLMSDLNPSEIDLLILPGGDAWVERDYPERTFELFVGRIRKAGVPVAAICGATLGVIRAGLAWGKQHTSNGLDFLKQSLSEYEEEGFYVDELAVRDRGLITASGLGAIEFAREIFAELDVFSDENLDLWYRLFKYGRVE